MYEERERGQGLDQDQEELKEWRAEGRVTGNWWESWQLGEGSKGEGEGEGLQDERGRCRIRGRWL